ncbi:uncharacterized protein LOC116613973 [Nematostella vectensis]|uniref:uncharacterized protein LOC116613973 n=1 Tax=Nematostella vectensis TaxID=45351 RepID=UPI00139068AB|nr:uncharacterized protein LOC116613973 [Nematostella vectensis]
MSQLVLACFVFVFTLAGNLGISVSILQLKRREEGRFQDRTRHNDVLFLGLTIGNLLGNLLVFPPLFYMYDMAERGMDIPGSLCVVIGSLEAFYFTYSAVLVALQHVHHLFSIVFPFQYLIYSRKKHSKIPKFCICVSFLIAAASTTISATVEPKSYKYIHGFGNVTFYCVPDFTSSWKFMPITIVGVICLLVTFGIYGRILFEFVKIKEHQNQIGRVYNGCCVCLGFPSGSCFIIAKGILYFTWGPLTIMLVLNKWSEGYHIAPEAYIITHAMLFIPPLLGPIVFYSTHNDLQEVCNEALCKLLSKTTYQPNRQDGNQGAPVVFELACRP